MYKIKSFILGKDNTYITDYFLKKRLLKRYEDNLKGYKSLFSYFDYSKLEDYDYLYPNYDDQIKQCIFCLKSNPDVSFSSRPHVIPEFLGNRYLLQHEECDSCNSYFSSTLEDALDKYSKIYRTLDKIKNKRRKLVSYSSINQKSKVSFDKQKNIYTFMGYQDKDFLFDDNKNELTGIFEVPKHRPVNIYKSFMKIFYGLLPRDHHKKFTLLREWIRTEDPTTVFLKPLEVIKTRLPGFNKKPLVVEILYKQNKNLELMLRNKDTEDTFEYIALLGFGNVVFEMPLLSDIDCVKLHQNIKMNLKRFPNPYFINTYERLDLSNPENVITTETVVFSYKERIALPELEGTLIAQLSDNLDTILKTDE